MRGRMARWLKVRQGAAMVEFALVLPLLALILFGIMEAGRAWHTEQVMATASREGARVGAIWNQTYTSDTVVAAIRRMLVGGSVDTVTTVLWPPSTNCTTAGSVICNLNLGGQNGGVGSGGADTIIVRGTLTFPVLSRLTGGLVPATRPVSAMTVMHNE